MKFVTCETSRYYDLIELPHGHIPAPRVRFWRHIPIPIGNPRGENFFKCWSCGAPSFFRTYDCDYCQIWGGCDSDFQDWKKYNKREKKRMKWKKIEYALLPLLVLFGQVKYNQSMRTHHTDSDYSWFIHDDFFTLCSESTQNVKEANKQ